MTVDLITNTKVVILKTPLTSAPSRNFKSSSSLNLKTSDISFPSKQLLSSIVNIHSREVHLCIQLWEALTERLIWVSTQSCITQKSTYFKVAINNSLVVSQGNVKEDILEKLMIKILTHPNTNSTFCLLLTRRPKTN